MVLLVPTFAPFTCHWYAGVVPPLVAVAVNVADAPTHSGFVPEVKAIIIAGITEVLTVIVFVAIPVHPAVLVPVTVYVVVAEGVTETLAPDKLPGIQVYVDAPLADKVVLAPVHIVELGVDTVTLGSALTVIVFVAVPVHPEALVPVTV